MPVEGGGGAAYNAFTGACIDLGEQEFQRVSDLLGSKSGIDFSSLGAHAVKLGGALITGGFLIDSGFDELTALQQRWAQAKDAGPLALTINPTFACNLDCGYCFVAKKQGSMSLETEGKLIKFVDDYLKAPNVPGLEVDWFGGEPLLASNSIGRLSEAFLAICKARSVEYRAQIITNGTLLDCQLAEQLQSWGIDRIQITLDGIAITHNQRRRWKTSKRSLLPIIARDITPKRSSFEDTLRGVEAAIGRFAVRLRVNVDRNNLDQCLPLLSLFEARGWLRPEARFYPYPALVRDYTEAAAVHWSMAEDCGTEAFYDLHRQWLDALNARGIPVVKESLYGFPEPKATACGAVSTRSWIINEDGRLHKCGFDGDNDGLSVGRIDQQTDPDNYNLKFWATYDHFTDPVCRECRALPLCQGGCARDHRDRREQAVSEVCEYRLKYEPQILAQHIRLHRENGGG